MRIKIDSKITLTDVPGSIKWKLKKRLSFMNPKFLEAKRMGRWVGNIPQTLNYFEETSNGFTIPRGFYDQLISLCRGVNPLVA